MKIDKEKFLLLSMSMSLSLAPGCQKKAAAPAKVPTNVEASAPQDLGQYSLCQESYIEGQSRSFSYDSYNECYIECNKGEQTQCYDVYDECYDWNSSDECIDYRTETYVTKAKDGCAKWEPDNPVFECVDWN